MEQAEREARARKFEKQTNFRRKVSQGWDRSRFVQAGRVLKDQAKIARTKVVAGAKFTFERARPSNVLRNVHAMRKLEAQEGKKITQGALSFVEAMLPQELDSSPAPSEFKQQLRLERQRQQFALKMAKIQAMNRARQARQLQQARFTRAPIDDIRERDAAQLQRRNTLIEDLWGSYRPAYLPRHKQILNTPNTIVPTTQNMSRNLMRSPPMFLSAPHLYEKMLPMQAGTGATARLEVWRTNFNDQPTILGAENVFSDENSRKHRLRW